MLNSKTLLIAAGFLGGIAILALLVMPEWENRKMIREELAIEKGKKILVAEDVQALKAYLKEPDDVSEEDRARLDRVLPEEHQEAFVLLNVMRLAERNGLLVQRPILATTNPNAGSWRGVVSVKASVRGNYAALKNFLEAISKNLRIMTIQSLTFKRPGEEDQQIINAAFELSSFFVPAKSQP